MALILLVLPVFSCGDPVGPALYPLVLERSDDQLSPEERVLYQEDAVRLAIRRLLETASPARHDVNPPAGLVASLYNALVHVHAAAHPARDSVVELFRVHTFPEPATREIMVRVDPAQPWTHAWRALRPETGNATVDALVNQYALTVRHYYQWSIGDVAVLRADRPLNATALAARFAPLPGVIWAERNGVVGDGNDIRATPHGDGWRLDYSVGFGDCPAGCIARHGWSFTVNSTGDVRFLGTFGDPLP